MNLRGLADLLGLSPTTVSRALNGYPEVSAKTRRRVEEAARLHGYQPNQIAQRLATGRTRTIAHVVGLADRDVVNPVFSDFIAGAGETYAARGYNMLVSFVADKNEPDTYRKLAAQSSVDGVILHSPRCRDPRIALLRELELPFLVHGRVVDGDGRYAWLDIDNRRAFEEATAHLITLGHRRIAFLNGPEPLSFAHRRLVGYSAAHHAAGLPVDPGLIFNAAMTEQYGNDVACEILSSGAVTGFVTSSIVTAIGVRRAVENRGLTLGRDVSVVTHDDMLAFLPNDGETPVFTATRSSVLAAGRRSASILIDSIEGTNPSAPRTELWPAELIIGQSSGPAMRAARPAAVRS